jgi:hypothetical protein
MSIRKEIAKFAAEKQAGIKEVMAKAVKKKMFGKHPLLTAAVGGAAAGTAAGTMSAIAGRILAPKEEIKKKASYSQVTHADFDFTEGTLKPPERKSSRIAAGSLPGGLHYDNTKKPGPIEIDDAGFYRHLRDKGGIQNTDRAGYSQDKFPIIKTPYGD